MPILTLITSVLNGMPYLAGAFDSIGWAAAREIEHVVVDAGSSDGTLAFLRGRRNIRLFERPAMPLYAAWNLGLAEASGDFVGFLNADDLLGPGGAAEILTALTAAPELDVLCGEAEAFAEGASPQESPRYSYHDPAVTGPRLDTFLFGAPIINAKFFRHGLFSRIGQFDTRLSLAADRDFLLRLLLAAAPVCWRQEPRLLYRYRIHGGSQTLGGSPQQRLRIADDHCLMVANLLALPGLDRDAARAMKALAAREGLVAALYQGRAGRIGRMLAALSRLAASDPIFPVRLRAATAGVGAFRRAVSHE